MKRNNLGNCPQEMRMEGIWNEGRQFYVKERGMMVIKPCDDRATLI